MTSDREKSVDILPPSDYAQVRGQQVLVAHVGQGAIGLSKAPYRRRVAVRVDEPEQLDRKRLHEGLRTDPMCMQSRWIAMTENWQKEGF